MNSGAKTSGSEFELKCVIPQLPALEVHWCRSELTQDINRPHDIVIAVMGITGVGKSSFISLLTDDEVVVGRELTSCKPRFARERG